MLVTPKGSPSRAEPWSGDRSSFRLAQAPSVLERRVDLSADEDRNPGKIEPDQQRHHGAQRTIGAAIGIRVVQIDPQTEGTENPKHYGHQGARWQPLPFAHRSIRSQVIDQIEG